MTRDTWSVGDDLKAALVEVARSEKAVTGGSPRDFWVNRLTVKARDLEQAAKLLRMQVQLLKRGVRLVKGGAQ